MRVEGLGTGDAKDTASFIMNLPADRFSRRLLLAVSWWIAMTAAHACSIPVFRFALDRWEADGYRLEVPKSAANDPALAALLRNLGDSSPVNLRLVASSDDGATESRLLFPREEMSVWSGRLDATSFLQLAQSPARAEIVRRLLSGESGVWVLLESGQKELDDSEAARLQKRIAFLETVAALPSIDPTDPTSRLGPGPELRVKFSLLRVASTDTQEAVLRRMLLGPKQNPAATSEGSMAALVFGRGRVLGAWPMKDLGDESVDEACLYLLGACSCEVKRANPGWDLLCSVDWNQALNAAADAGASKPDRNTAGASPERDATETITIQPETPPAQKESNNPANSWRFWLLPTGTGVLLALSVLWSRRARRSSS